MEFDTPDNLMTRMRATRVSRRTILRGLLGGAAVVLNAAGIPTADVEADKKPGKAGKWHRAKAGKWHRARNRNARKRRGQGNTSCTTAPTDGTAATAMLEEPVPGQIIIDDPCEAFSDDCCSEESLRND